MNDDFKELEEDDLFDDNIYKLIVEDKIYLVPLWHNEIYFDGDGYDIIVYCVPIIDNVTIDENNNIYYELNIHFNKEKGLMELDSQWKEKLDVLRENAFLQYLQEVANE